jgi:hypothetical protein
MVWTLASAELSAFVDGPRECPDRVFGYERPSVAVFPDKFHLHLSPAWCCELGHTWILHRAGRSTTS